MGSSSIVWGTAPQDGMIRVRFPVDSLRILKWSVSSEFSIPGVHSACNNNENQGISLGSRPGRTAESSTVLAVPKAKTSLETEHYIHPHSLDQFLRKSITFTFIYSALYYFIQPTA